jgi:hypothetical protein
LAKKSMLLPLRSSLGAGVEAISTRPVYSVWRITNEI